MTVETKTQSQQSRNPIPKPVQPPPQAVVSQPELEPLPVLLQRATLDVDSISPKDAGRLQRTVGNRAVGELGDGGLGGATAVSSSNSSHTLQHMLNSQAQAKRPFIQPKLTLGPVGDKYEQEADAVAQQVVSNLGQPPPAQRQEEEEEMAQMKPSVQRQEEEEMQMKPLPAISALQRQEEEELQAKGDPMLAGGELSKDVESSVQRAKSGGQPISDNLRGSMEQAFNADFSRIKVHTDSQADTLNRSLSARAFTSGPDIFFRNGEYNPNNSDGKELLVHELTHTVQQGAAPVQRQEGVTLSSDNHVPIQRDIVEGIRQAIVQRKIGHHAKVGEAVYNEELFGGEVTGKITGIHTSSRAPLLNTRIPKLGLNVRIPNPLPKVVGSMQKGHNKIAKAVDSYDIQGDDGQYYGGVKPEGRPGSVDEAWNLVSRDERIESAGPSMMDKASKMVQGGQALVAGRDRGYEELGGGGLIAVATTYGSHLLPALTDLQEILQGRIEAQSTRHTDAVASKAGTAGTIAGAIVTASKAIEKVGNALEHLDLAVEVTPVVGQIYQAIKLAAKIVKMIATIYITYKSLQDEGTQVLMSFSEQVAASGAIEAITALSAEIAEDEDLTEAARSTVTTALAQAIDCIKAGVQKYDQLEKQVRSAVSVGS